MSSSLRSATADFLRGSPLGATVEAAARPMMIVSESGSVLFSTPAARELFACDVAGRPLRELIAAEDRDRVASALHTATHQQAVARADARSPRDAAANFTVRLCFGPLANGGSSAAAIVIVSVAEAAAVNDQESNSADEQMSGAQAGSLRLTYGHHVLTGIVRDMSELRQAEAATRASESLLHDILDALPIAVMVLDEKGMVVRSNPVCDRIWGEALGGASLENRFRGKAWGGDAGQPLGSRDWPAARALEQGEAILDEIIEMETVGGVRRTMLCSAVPFRDATGAIRGVIVTSQDATEYVAAQRTVRQREQELTHLARLNTMGEMVSSIAHELNQPLTAIANHAHVCLRRSEGGSASTAAPLDESLQEIAEQARRAGEIIRRLRSFVRRDEARYQPHDVNDLIRSVAEMLAHEARLNQIGIDFRLAENLPRVSCDRIQIEQVLVNLLRNAFDAMLDAAPQRRRATLTTEATAEGVEVRVADGGRGIASELLSTVFEPFFTTKPQGLGMGLAICHSILKNHRGALWLAEGKPNQGATFCFRLPPLSKDH